MNKDVGTGGNDAYEEGQEEKHKHTNDKYKKKKQKKIKSTLR